MRRGSSSGKKPAPKPDISITNQEQTKGCHEHGEMTLKDNTLLIDDKGGLCVHRTRDPGGLGFGGPDPDLFLPRTATCTSAPRAIAGRDYFNLDRAIINAAKYLFGGRE